MQIFDADPDACVVPVNSENLKEDNGAWKVPLAFRGAAGAVMVGTIPGSTN